MEVTRIQPQKPPLQQLFRVTFASVVFLLVVSIWAIVNYCEDESTNMQQLTTVMQPTYTYFDTNRGLAPITDLCVACHTRQRSLMWAGCKASEATASIVAFCEVSTTFHWRSSKCRSSLEDVERN